MSRHESKKGGREGDSFLVVPGADLKQEDVSRNINSEKDLLYPVEVNEMIAQYLTREDCRLLTNARIALLMLLENKDKDFQMSLTALTGSVRAIRYSRSKTKKI